MDNALRAGSASGTPEPSLSDASTGQEALCYVEDSFAYFTTQPLKDQWGDDWDDAPYEHNAGTPYGPWDGEDFQIIKVAFDGWFSSPCDGHMNSPYTVRDINGGVAPWLETYDREHRLFAGATIAEFTKFVTDNEGKVYRSVEASERPAIEQDSDVDGAKREDFSDGAKRKGQG